MSLQLLDRYGFKRNPKSPRQTPSWSQTCPWFPVTSTIQLRRDGFFDYAFCIGSLRHGVCRKQGVTNSLEDAIALCVNWNLR